MRCATLPDLVGKLLDPAGHEVYEQLAQTFFHYRDFLYLGRGINYPIALEGALKLKEISYIHAEGYTAGAMKHGPIALIDENMPVVTIVPQDRVDDKMLSQVEQVKARGGVVIAVADEGDDFIATKADHVLWVPQTIELLKPVLTVIPLQLLAYHMAVRRGTMWINPAIWRRASRWSRAHRKQRLQHSFSFQFPFFLCCITLRSDASLHGVLVRPFSRTLRSEYQIKLQP